MQKRKTVIALAAAVLVLTGAAWALTSMAIREQKKEDSHVVVEGISYDTDAEQLDLRDREISRNQYEELCGKLPACEILWNVPFQGNMVPSDTESLTVTELTQEDAAMLGYFPELCEMDAKDCRDYDILMMLLEKRPRCRIHYNVELGGRLFEEDTEEISLAAGESSGEELLKNLTYLKKLKKVHLEEPEISAEQLRKLTETYPCISFSWDKTLFDQKLSSSTEFLDLSGRSFESLSEVQKQTEYLPALKQVDMLNCGFSNEEMKAFRDQMRNRCKIVFNVQVGSMDLRTDVLTFFPDRDHGKVRNKDTYNLRYCEDLVCVDVGHLGFSDVDWVEGTPHLKYLIMSDGGAWDLTPLGQLQELEFLELFMTGVADTSPLVTCKALKDLNLCRAPLGDITPLTQMPWLEKLWVSHCPLSTEERELLKESLPNTHIEFDEYYSTWGGWRDMPRYFDMRDVLGVPYMR